jgi:uncharacterized membrane protein
MWRFHNLSSSLATWAKLAVGLLIFKTTFVVVWGYRDYFPPNFRADFLLGRQSYFFGPYAWAFYTHIASGPITLLLSFVLLSERFRRWAPSWHRRLGRVQVALVLLLLTPSGLAMARYAATGPIAASGFATLSVLTAACITLGWRAAVRCQFAVHRRWMLRTATLLSSAVVLRLMGGMAEVVGATGTYPWAAWLSWIVPLAVVEIALLNTRPAHSQQSS